MKNKQMTALIVVIFLMCAANLAFALDAKTQRKTSSNQRNETICILKIQPVDRSPDKLAECHK